MDILAAEANLLADPRDPPPVTPDPKDDYLPALARSAGADHLVSGDRKHLPPDPAARPPVVHPAQMLELLAGSEAPQIDALASRRVTQLAAWREQRRRWQRAHGPHGRVRGD